MISLPLNRVHMRQNPLLVIMSDANFVRNKLKNLNQRKKEPGSYVMSDNGGQIAGKLSTATVLQLFSGLLVKCANVGI